ncbi:MAG: YitT family protein [Pseudomonadota bacterium]
MPSPLMTIEVPEDALRHSWYEDLQGLGIGTLFTSFAVYMITHLGFMTGQTAGLALLISYSTGWSFGPVFFVINIPFYLFAYLRLGTMFTVKSFICVGLMSAFTEVAPNWIELGTINPLFGAVFIGCLAAIGLIAMFRHGGSMGGLGVVALYIQDATGFRAGWVQMIFDVFIFGAAFFVLPPLMVFYSLIGAVVLNLAIAINHRRDRYIAS